MRQQKNIEFIFGGSFDPVHWGHINVINALRKLSPHWPIRLLPCSVAALDKNICADFAQRVDMLRMATQSIKNVIIDQRESERSGKSYTLLSLQEILKEALPGDEVHEKNISEKSISEKKSFEKKAFEKPVIKKTNRKKMLLVVGDDVLPNLQQWYRWQELANHCHLLLINRANNKVDKREEIMQKTGFSLAKNIQSLQTTDYGQYWNYIIREKAVSSTEIRSRLASQMSIEELVPNEVNRYIGKNHLYNPLDQAVSEQPYLTDPVQQTLLNKQRTPLNEK